MASITGKPKQQDHLSICPDRNTAHRAAANCHQKCGHNTTKGENIRTLEYTGLWQVYTGNPLRYILHFGQMNKKLEVKEIDIDM